MTKAVQGFLRIGVKDSIYSIMSVCWQSED